MGEGRRPMALGTQWLGEWQWPMEMCAPHSTEEHGAPVWHVNITWGSLHVGLHEGIDRCTQSVRVDWGELGRKKQVSNFVYWWRGNRTLRLHK